MDVVAELLNGLGVDVDGLFKGLLTVELVAFGFEGLHDIIL